MFRYRLLPELQFIADLPTQPYDSVAVLEDIRQPPPIPADPTTLAQVTFVEETIAGFNDGPLVVRIYQPWHHRSDRLVVWCHGRDSSRVISIPSIARVSTSLP
ncbi:hypothetical protein BXP70_22885 [Hymenobacter crusticola]|uniref:Uncharacterized protein n=1 Tax=Hymenobacter crusticola TaxID=1770526 RepID=A0A243W7I4_9BACT|nr:hypothetical protein BXP70_22885 [Hymenobacter crusticola]